MAFSLNFLPGPYEVLHAVLDDPERQDLAVAVDAALDRLEDDPGDPKLGTTHFTTSGYGHIRSTPVGREGWMVIWQLSPTMDKQLDVVFLGDPTEATTA